ncbi:GIN domain-containing protein [Sphingobium aromaticiconvertens]|uniref:GIN domain-containing protein n=1 Tax=Sphingobium aromaticiconvertens TaxID=365341 RepID=UPI00301941B0
MQKVGHGIGRSALRRLTPRLIGTLGVALTATPGAALADTQSYTISSFDSLRVEAPVNVILTTGGGSSGRGEGPRATLERLRVEVSGRVLKISMVAATGGGRSAGPATLRFSTGDLRRVMLTGGGSITVNRMKGLSGDIVLGGNGDVTIQAVDVDRLTVMLAGGGRATLAGRAGVADLRVSGPGSIAAEKLTARQSRLSSDGPGEIAVITAVSADIRSSGSGDVTVQGKPACTVKNLGTGRIYCAGESY